MTPKQKSTTVQSADTPSQRKTDSKEIDDILKKVEVSPTPIKEKLDKRGHRIGGRGRPKKIKKPTYTKSKYSENPLAKSINTMLSTALNKSLLKESTDKIAPTELEVGEALTYLMDYYASALLFHPAMIIIMALLSMVMVVVAKMQKIPKKTQEEKSRIESGEKI